jgi:hypothetical protein
MKLTESFPADILPTRPGVYLTRRSHDGINFWRAFDGKDWHYGIVTDRGAPSYTTAKRKMKMTGIMVNFQWWGLAEEQKED